MLEEIKEDFRYMNFKGIEVIGEPVVYGDGRLPMKAVGFRPFIHDNSEGDNRIPMVLTYRIVGFEQEDGSVIIFKNGHKLERPLRNKKIFEEKYFTEAI